MAEDRAQGARPFVAGLNHRTSTLTLRDRLFVEDEGVGPIVQRLSAAGLDEVVVLATCDRVEIMGASETPEESAARALSELAQARDVDESELRAQTYIHADEAAIRHVFSVAASLDSLVVGEPQVLGQVKAGHRLARDAGMPAGVLDQVLQSAYAAAKRVRSETKIGSGPVSIAAAAVASVRDLHGDLDRVSALLIGAGEMGELVAGNMLNDGLANLTVTHPSPGRAARAARRLESHHAAFEDLSRLLMDADVVISALGSGSYILSADQVRMAIEKRRYRPVFLIDTAIPGDIEPAVHRLDDAFLYDIADLERLAMEGMAEREAEAETAWKIIDQEVAAFLSGRREREAAPLVSALRMRFEREREAVLREVGGDAERATQLLINRLLHGPSTQLRAAAAAANMDLAEAEALLARLFDEPAADGNDKKETER